MEPKDKKNKGIWGMSSREWKLTLGCWVTALSASIATSAVIDWLSP